MMTCQQIRVDVKRNSLALVRPPRPLFCSYCPPYNSRHPPPFPIICPPFSIVRPLFPTIRAPFLVVRPIPSFAPSSASLSAPQSPPLLIRPPLSGPHSSLVQPPLPPRPAPVPLFMSRSSPRLLLVPRCPPASSRLSVLGYVVVCHAFFYPFAPLSAHPPIKKLHYLKELR